MRKYKVKVKVKVSVGGNPAYKDADGYYDAMAWASVPNKPVERYGLFDDVDDFGSIVVGTIVRAENVVDVKRVS